MTVLNEVLQILDNALQLNGRSSRFDRSTPLLGELPELDSMGVLAVISGLESHFGVSFHDEQLSGQRFSSVGALCDLVEESLQGDPDR